MTIQQAIDHWYKSNGGHATLNTAIHRIGSEYHELCDAGSPEHIQEEMADVASCLFQAASIAGFDLIEAVWRKLAINCERKWTVGADGCLRHVKGSDPREEAT